MSPCGAFDHLIISMGITLSHIHGRDNVCVVTADDRTDILAKCSSVISPATLKKLKLVIAKEVVGKPYNRALFPKYINLKTAKKADLEAVFGDWPFGIVPAHYRSLR